MGRTTARPDRTILSQRALNRALLARQMLLERTAVPVADAVSRLGGMQAQSPQAPYVGLWSRLDPFRPEELSDLITSRKAVRMAVMRGTVHLVTASDARAFRPVVQPVLDRTLVATSFGKDVRGVDREALIATGRAAIEKEPLTLAALRPILAAAFPDFDARSLSHAFHHSAPLVQVPPRGLWRQGGLPKVTTAEALLGAPLAKRPKAEALVLRYLAAFGPASIIDAQAWSGVTKLRPVFERLRPKLITFRDEWGRELFDLPDAPRPDADVPAPVRFLPEFENLTLGHANRGRVVVAGPHTGAAKPGRPTFPGGRHGRRVLEDRGGEGARQPDARALRTAGAE